MKNYSYKLSHNYFLLQIFKTLKYKFKINKDYNVKFFVNKSLGKKPDIKKLYKNVNEIVGFCIFNKFNGIFQIHHLFSTNNFESIVQYLINKNKCWTCLDLNNVKKLEKYTELGFHTFYISNLNLEQDKIPISLCMTYDKPQSNEEKQNNYKYALELIKQYKNNKVDYCTAKALVDIKLARKLKKLVFDKEYKKKEKAGELFLDGFVRNSNELIFRIGLNEKDIKKGNHNEANIVFSMYNFHTHPEDAYVSINCDLGWPSLDDYKTFLYGIKNFGTIFHLVVTMEGIYILTISKDSANKILKWKDSFIEKKVEPWIDTYFHIDKQNFKKKEGTYTFDNVYITDENSYIKYMNNLKFENNQIFNIHFLDWNHITNPKLLSFFHFYYPKDELKSCNLDLK